MKNLLKPFKRKKPKLYYYYQNKSFHCILLNRYDNQVNLLAINDPFAQQMRDITFYLLDAKKSSFIEAIEELGYTEDRYVLIKQLEREGQEELLESPTKLEDWFIGDDDIMF